MCYDRWLHFAHWVAGQRTDPCMLPKLLLKQPLVWDPHNIGEEQKIEKIQKRAYKYIYGVKSIPNYILYLKEYKILPLHQRRVYNRLCMFYKIINGLIDINFDQNLTWAQGRCLRKNNTLQIKTTLIRTDNYKYSFFPRTINDNK